MATWVEWWEGKAPGGTQSAREFGVWVFWQSVKATNLAARVTARHCVSAHKWVKGRLSQLREEQRQAAEQAQERQRALAQAAEAASPAGLKRVADAERARQIVALRNAVPQTPPERMRATIHINPVSVFTTIRKETNLRRFEEVEVQRYSVDMILELSERDRATILQNHLDQVAFEHVPVFRGDQILQMMADFDRQYNSHSSISSKGLLMRAMMDQTRRSYQDYASETKEITLADYMKAPYERICETLPAANDYADELKTVLLPQVRELLDRSADRKPTETVEF